MAREKQARENLIAEATALVERVELLLPGVAEPVVAGFRTDGSASLFFADDPVYQFNSQGKLRRAFVGGLLYKANAGRLVEMTRNREGGQLQLVSREMSAAALAEFMAGLRSRLSELANQLKSGRVQVLAEVSPRGCVIARLERWLADLGENIEIGSSPHAR